MTKDQISAEILATEKKLSDLRAKIAEESAPLQIWQALFQKSTHRNLHGWTTDPILFADAKVNGGYWCLDKEFVDFSNYYVEFRLSRTKPTE
jgi:hypothetical protein